MRRIVRCSNRCRKNEYYQQTTTREIAKLIAHTKTIKGLPLVLLADGRNQAPHSRPAPYGKTSSRKGSRQMKTKSELVKALENAAKSMDSAIRILNDFRMDYEDRVFEARAYLHSRAAVAYAELKKEAAK